MHRAPTEQGCTWLQAACAGKLDTGLLADGKCPRGYRAAGQMIRLDGAEALLLAVEESPAAPTSSLAPQSADGTLQQLESMSRLLERIGQLLDENEGLADEVLRGYEQLNLIYDFTQQIVQFTDAEEIEKTLLGRLAGLLRASAVLVAGADGNYRVYNASLRAVAPDADTQSLINRLAEQVEMVQQSRTLSVHSSPAACVLLGPLVRLDDQVDAVLAIRHAGAGEFTSGDMLMIESLLAFGGQIISNAEVHERLRRMSLESTRALVAAIDKKDHYTSGHSERVGLLAKLVGQRLGLPSDKLRILEMSGLLHDVGKIGIPEGILCKPGKLTNEEYDIIKEHPRMGWEILKPIASFDEVLDGVLYHHENPDGSGYPEGRARGEIPLFARIIHVVDVFDALTSTRSYRVRFSLERACNILQEEAGNRLESDIVAIFLEALPELRQTNPEAFAGAAAVEQAELSHAEA